MAAKEDDLAYRSLCDLAFEHAPIGLVLTENRVIVACNRTFADIFGYEKDELIGQSFRVLYASREDFDRIRDIGLTVLKSGEHYTDERIMPRKDGSLFWCRFRARSLTPDDPPGDPPGQHPGLARPRPGQDHHRSAARRHRLDLGPVQAVEQVSPSPGSDLPSHPLVDLGLHLHSHPLDVSAAR